MIIITFLSKECFDILVKLFIDSDDRIKTIECLSATVNKILSAAAV